MSCALSNNHHSLSLETMINTKRASPGYADILLYMSSLLMNRSSAGCEMLPHRLAINGGPLCLIAPIHPFRTVCLSRRPVTALTHLQESHPSVLADGVTELSSRSRESICQGITIMNHPLAMHTARFPFHTQGSVMDSGREVAPKGEEQGSRHSLPGSAPFGDDSGRRKHLLFLTHLPQ